jgi:hypothetical protein
MKAILYFGVTSENESIFDLFIYKYYGAKNSLQV